MQTLWCTGDAAAKSSKVVLDSHVVLHLYSSDSAGDCISQRHRASVTNCLAQMEPRRLLAGSDAPGGGLSGAGVRNTAAAAKCSSASWTRHRLAHVTGSGSCGVVILYSRGPPFDVATRRDQGPCSISSSSTVLGTIRAPTCSAAFSLLAFVTEAVCGVRP